MVETLPARDDHVLLEHPLPRALAYFGAGVVTAIGVDALSLVDPGFQHTHVAPGVSPTVALLAPLPHEALFALPLVVLLVVLTRETRPSPVFLGLAATICGLAVTNALILPA